MLSRRRLLQMLGGLSVLGSAGWAFSATAANAYYQGPVSDHFDGVRFFNPGREGPKGLAAFLRWQLTDRGAAWPRSFASPFPPDQPPARFEGDGVRLAHVGHATVLLQTRGLNVLVDPVWAKWAGPFSFAMPKRVNPPGISFDALPRIDVVLITHNHYDHMDAGTVGRLWQLYRPRIIVPLGNDTILKSSVPGLAAEAVDWDAEISLGNGIAVHVEPSQHWSARWTRDRMHALWASFVLVSPSRKIYCAGDSGFGDGAIFRRVRQRHPNLSLALLPIGAYEPRWFMRSSHINPQEAVEAMELTGAARALGYHWGTFHLSNEAIDQPLTDLAVALARRDIAPARFSALHPGEVHIIE